MQFKELKVNVTPQILLEITSKLYFYNNLQQSGAYP